MPELPGARREGDPRLDLAAHPRPPEGRPSPGQQDRLPAAPARPPAASERRGPAGCARGPEPRASAAQTRRRRRSLARAGSRSMNAGPGRTRRMAAPAERRAAGGAAAALRALARLREQYAPGFGVRKLEALQALEPRGSDGARGDALHDMLCFLRAYPDSRALLAAVERRCSRRFARRADLRRHARALEDSGIAGTAIRFRFFAPMARWLARRWPERAAHRLGGARRPGAARGAAAALADHAETPALDEIDSALRELDRDGSSGPARATPRSWLARRSGRASRPLELTENALGRPRPAAASSSPGPGTPSRTRAIRASRAARRLSGARSSRGRPDLRAELERPPRLGARADARRGCSASSTSRARRW